MTTTTDTTDTNPAPGTVTPQAEIRHAARNLRRLHEAATPGRWYAIGDHLAHDVKSCTCGSGGATGPHEPYCGCEPVGGPFGVTADGTCPDAELVAVLRGIPASLVLLLMTVSVDAVWSQTPQRVKDEALIVARAVNVAVTR